MDDQNEGVEIPVVWQIPENVRSEYVNNMVVQHTEHEFLLYFFETHPHLFVGSQEQVSAALEQMGPVKARFVIRFVVTPRKMREFIEVLQTNYSKYLAKFSDSEESE